MRRICDMLGPDCERWRHKDFFERASVELGGGRCSAAKTFVKPLSSGWLLLQSHLKSIKYEGRAWLAQGFVVRKVKTKLYSLLNFTTRIPEFRIPKGIPGVPRELEVS